MGKKNKDVAAATEVETVEQRKAIVELPLAFWAAVKRKNVTEILREVFDATGHDEAAELAKNTTRLTVSAIDRLKDATGFVDPVDEEEAETPEETEAPEETEEPEELTYADKDAEQAVVDHQFADIRKAIKKGKGKKALKLINEAKAAGARGSVLKDLKKQAKEL